MVQNKMKRIEEFDIAKGIAILCVILGHLGIFFLISGYFISTRYSFEEFQRRKIKGILWPYLFTCFLICILSIPVNYFLHQDILHNMLKWVCGSFYGAGIPDVPIIFKNYSPFIGALWFLLALFWGALITRKIIDVSKNDMQSMFIVSILFYIGWKTSESIWLPFDIQAGLTSTLFIFIGYLAKKHEIFSCKTSKLLILLLIFISIWNMKYFKGLWFAKKYFGNSLYDIIAALSTSFLLMKLCSKIKVYFRYLSLALEWYGKNSIIVLAFHIIELDLFPWGIWIDFVDKLYENHTFTILSIIIIKFVWVSLGIIIVNNCKTLKYFYSGGRG